MPSKTCAARVRENFGSYLRKFFGVLRNNFLIWMFPSHSDQNDEGRTSRLKGGALAEFSS